MVLLLCAVPIFPVSVLKRLQYYTAGFRKSSWVSGHVPSEQEVARQKKLFGYDLSITHIKDQSLATVHPERKRVKLFVHGFAENKNQAMVFSGHFGVISGDFVTFNLPDRVSFIPPIINRWYHTSFGQINEILPTLYALNYLRAALELDGIDLIGYSRGAAVITNMLFVLFDTTGAYDQALASIGIDTEDRLALIQLLEQGSIVLTCPLRSMKKVFEDHWIVSKIPGHVAAIGYATKFKTDGMQPLESAHALSRFSIPLLIHYQHNDESVGSAYESEFYSALAERNSKDTFLLVGNDGGHTVLPKSLRNAVHTFYRQVGASYDMTRDMLYEKLLTTNAPEYRFLQKPAIHATKTLLQKLHAQCEVHRK